MSAGDSIYSVSQLNREAKRLLATHFMTVRVEGEISNFSAPSSGHWYFSLKDAQAQIRCAMFRGQQQRLGFKPGNGDLVVVNAQVSLYEPRGDYQLVVEHMEQAGDGALRQAFERLKNKLLAEGLFDANRKQDIPLIPQQIGIITSASGAAIHDILTVLQRRFPAVPVVIYPVAVQGESAKFEISAALELANQRAEADVLILTRGGGSLEDLWAFNEEIVARAVAASRIPVIAGIGHEVDFTIADFVADFRAPTPSAAAEHAVPSQAEWLGGFKFMENQLLEKLRRQLSQQQQRLDWLNKSLQLQHPGEKLQRNAQRLDELEIRLKKSTLQTVLQAKQLLALNSQKLRHFQPTDKIVQHRQSVDFYHQRLQRAMRLKLSTLKQQQTGISQTLHAVSPLATLDRGYAIVKQQSTGQIVKSVADLAENDLLETRLAKGRVISLVKKVIPS
ncbi:exodeoxyribonuclease VII large subunit [Methylomonas methanica]|uniref:Exodeoxyribonuclease 7 large subunit n=1 Tax=Methylomonas methanica (strain DSM 25384 / MC09) TaxID=857087 RepID=F9ZX58_METMM|nr:exodeoxyribonuclease VII large subunit [Methylomonas methanica]AEF99668.1 Exodeoxyribonuclease 7 large subunit [Methylomonas methanica MC09]